MKRMKWLRKLSILLVALILAVSPLMMAVPVYAEEITDEEYAYAQFGDFTIRLPFLVNGFSPRAVFISLRVADDLSALFCSAAYVTGFFGVNKVPTYGYTKDNWQVHIPEGSYVVLSTNEIVFIDETAVLDFEWDVGFTTNETYTYDMGASTAVGVWGGYELGDIWDDVELVDLVYLEQPSFSVVGVLETFSGVGSWLSGAIQSASTMFWTAESGMTVLGYLAVASLALAVILLIFSLIAGWLKFH